MTALTVLLASYLLGSIPFSYLIPRLLIGMDIREAGTRNVGAHNVMHQVGRIPGIVAGVLDAGKGVAAVALACSAGMPVSVVVLAGCCAVIGHTVPIWLGFRGGRGLATSLGVIVALMPFESLVPLALLTVLYIGITHNIAFSALVSFLTLAGIAWWRGLSVALIVTPLLLLILMGIRQIPEVRAMWHAADDKRDLILNKWIFDRDARL